MYVHVMQREKRLSVSTFDQNGRWVAVYAEKGMFKVDADIKVNGVGYRVSMYSMLYDDFLSLSMVGKAIMHQADSTGAGTTRYGVAFDMHDGNGLVHYGIETFFGENYQTFEVWQTEEGRSVNKCAVSYDPFNHSLIVRGDIGLLTAVIDGFVNGSIHRTPFSATEEVVW